LQFDVRSQPQDGATRKRQKIDAARRHVLAEVGRGDIETLVGKLVQQLSLDQMDLSQVWLGRVGPYTRAVLDRHSLMRVALDAETGHDPDSFH
jgi:hypothetical protein